MNELGHIRCSKCGHKANSHIKSNAHKDGFNCNYQCNCDMTQLMILAEKGYVK